MYTYNPDWGLSLVSSRGQAERLPGVPFFILCFLFVLSSQFICLFIHSFIHQFLFFLFFFCLSLCHSVAPMVPKAGTERETVSVKKEGFSHFLALFHFLPGIPLPSFYSLRSFVIFGRVSDTLVCLGNRAEGAIEDCSSREWRYMRGCTHGRRRLMKKRKRWQVTRRHGQVNLTRLIEWQRRECEISCSL